MPHIIILGIGNILFSDEGFGVRVIERLNELYEFPETIRLVDGGVLGMNLLGIISEAEHLIVIDAVRNGNPAGTLIRLAGSEIPARVRAKNSLHQVDFLEALTLCQALDNIPQTIILGIEPRDIETLKTELTPLIEKQIDSMIDWVLREVTALGGFFKKRSTVHVSGRTIQNCIN
jgi:hydrogenase maturation protease